MAELAIPLLGIGAIYILSNEEKKNKIKLNTNQQYSNINNTAFCNNLNSKNVSNCNQHTDKFYNENNYSSIKSQNTSYGVGNNDNCEFPSLTGNNINKDDFTHNNMVPFFGSKIRGATADNNVSQTILDNKQGAGSQIYKKREGAPLFSPENNVNNLFGSQNQTDFFQSRVNVGNNMAKTTLWEAEKVTPGLNLNYNEKDNMGFNSGYGARETWQPKTVDELRVDNNPKISYELNGHQGPAYNLVKQMGKLGKVEKHLPDKFYNNDPSRWITTTGVEKAQPQHGEYILHDQNRQNTSSEYFGNGGDGINTTYVERNFEEPKKINLQGLPISNASATGKANNDVKPSFTNYNNNRSTTQNQLDFGPVGGLAQAIITPIMDIIRPTRKENVVGNLRQSGNVQNSVTNGYLFNKNDTLPVTNREIYSKSINHLNVQTQNNSGNGYLVSNPELLGNQRDTTSINYTGNGGISNMGFKSNEAVNNQRNNNNKTYELRPNQGGTQMFNQQMNVCYSKNECDRNNNRMWVPTDAPKNYNNILSNNSRGLQTYDEQLNNDRINPDLLSAFKNNPYTQSLHSVA